MRILISNDDGINSKGISELAKAMKEIGDVYVVAPLTEQSAVGHAITMKIPLRVTEHYIDGEFFGYAVTGTPADCIKIGLKNILKFKPDIVISGINHGSNTAINIIYSGTVSAAREAAIMDVPALAVSVTNHRAKHFDYACQITQEFARKVIESNLPNGTLLNINVPDLPKDQVKGTIITKQGKSKWDDSYLEREDPYGGKYYWLTGSLMDVDNELITDQFAIKNNYASVSPIHFDLTDHEAYEMVNSWNIDSHKRIK